MDRLLALLDSNAEDDIDGTNDADALTLLCEALRAPNDADAANADANANADDATLVAALRALSPRRAEQLFLPTLLQLVHAAACYPSPRLARAACALCGASFAIALRTAWLVAALSADALPPSAGLHALQEGVSRGALEQGAWPPPFPSLSSSKGASNAAAPPASPSPHFRRSLELAGEEDRRARRPATPQPTTTASSSDPRADPYHASLDFMSALVATGAALNRCSGGPRRRAALLKKCLASISAEVEAAAAGGVGVWWPVLGAASNNGGGGGALPARVLRLCVDEAAVLNSRDKAPFLLVAEVQVQRPQQGDGTTGAASAAAYASPPASPPPRLLSLKPPPGQQEAAACSLPRPQSPPVVDVAALLDAAFQGRAGLGGAAAAPLPKQQQQQQQPQTQHQLHRTPTSEALSRMASEVGPGGRAAPPADVGPPLQQSSSRPSSSSSSSPSSWLPSWLRLRRPKQRQQQLKQSINPPSLTPEELAEHERKSVYGDQPWGERARRLRRASPHRHLEGWELRGCVVKVGDDCRQEALGMQLLGEIVEAWRRGGEGELEKEEEEGGGKNDADADADPSSSFDSCRCWARPLDVVVAGPGAGLIELLPDSASIHTVKQRTTREAAEAAAREFADAAECAAVAAAGRAAVEADARDDEGAAAAAGDGAVVALPPATAAAAAAAAAPPPPLPRPPGPLASHFFALYGPRASARRARAQRRFAGALAGYSLAAHFLAVRDRHNGNILLVGGGGNSDDGSATSAAARLVHIDLGFMLTNAPGGVRFEGPREAPFKLTRELLEVLDTDAETGGALLPEVNVTSGVSRPLAAFRAALVRGFLAARRGPAPRRLERLIRGAAGDWAVGGGGSSDPSSSAAQQKLAAAFPCFSGGGVEAAVAGVKERLALSSVVGGGGGGGGDGAGEEEDRDALVAVVKHVLELLAESMDAFASRQYDLYQRVVNGIL